jgi:hypothetical protein
MTRQMLRYALSVALPVATLLALRAFGDASTLGALFLVMLPVTLCAYVGGVGPGLTAAMVTVVGSLTLLTHPVDVAWARWLAALVAIPMVAGLGERVRRTLRAAAEAAVADISPAMANAARDIVWTVDVEGAWFEHVREIDGRKIRIRGIATDVTDSQRTRKISISPVAVPSSIN